LDKEIDILNPELQISKSFLTRISNSAYICLFDKSDEALVNDYEEILELLDFKNSVLTGDYLWYNKNTMKPKRFFVGTAFVDFKKISNTRNPTPLFKGVKIKYPSRLDSACTDPGKIYEYSPDNIYAAGQINFCIDICKTISVKLRNDENIYISERSPRKSLVLHSVLLMKKALEISNGFDIDIKNDLELRHCGLGSSASIIQGVGAAINEIFNNPITSMDLIRYLAGNHGEEIDGDDNHLIQVQSVGGSGVCGHYKGGLIIITGRAVPIVSVNLPSDIKIVFGVPKNYTHPDSNTLIHEEIKNISKFKKVSKDFSREIAYRLLNIAIPELIDGNYKPMKDFIFDYRWDMGSINNCAYAYPEITKIAEKMRPLKNDKDVIFVALSTAGPGFFIATKNIIKAKRIFSKLNMKTYIANIYNGKYKILKRE